MVAGALATTIDPEAVAACIVEAAVEGLGADHGWVSMVTPDGSAAEMLSSRGYPESTLAAWRRVPLTMEIPLTEAIRTGQPVFHDSADERLAAWPVIRERGGPTPGVEASATIPMVIEGRAIGALTVSFSTRRSLDADERWFLGALATQGSQALERARLFAALQEQGERLRFAMAASGTGTWEWDIGADRITLSPEVLALHGLPENDAPRGATAYLDLVHPGDRARMEAAFRHSLATGAPYDLEVRVVRPDGTIRWSHGAGMVVAGTDGRPARMLGTSRDITDRKLAELERDQLIEAERETARLRDAFISVVSHELRTPITTIYGGTRVLARRWRELEPDARDGILADVVEEADRLYRLAEDLLVLTRVERGTLDVGDEPVHLGRVLERVVGSEQARWPGVTFRVLVPPDLPSVRGEDTYAEQVIRNLVDNAAKYGGTGSTVTVEAAAEGGDVMLTVLDEGPGVDETETDRLFELFYRSPTVASSISGAGIGLFVCRRLVGAMGGHIHADRRPGGGATFVVTLPRYADDGEG